MASPTKKTEARRAKKRAKMTKRRNRRTNADRKKVKGR